MLLLISTISAYTQQRSRLDFNPRFTRSFFEQFVGIVRDPQVRNRGIMNIADISIPVELTTASIKSPDMSWVGTLIDWPTQGRPISLNIYVDHQELYNAFKNQMKKKEGIL